MVAVLAAIRGRMKRRGCLKAVLGVAGLSAVRAAEAGRPIQLHVDLSVDPAKEREMLDHFHNVFRPAAAKQPGFMDARMLKLRIIRRGEAPPGANYRFVLSFASEEQRQVWAATPLHQQVWAPIVNTLKNGNYTALLYDLT